MTKREFDKATKENWGGRMASDERCGYRRQRMLEHNGSGADNPWCAPSDYIARRAREMRRTRAGRYSHEPFLPTLGIGSKFRAPQAWLAQQGRPLLEGEGRPRWACI